MILSIVPAFYQKWRLKNAIWAKPLIYQRVLETSGGSARYSNLTQGPGALYWQWFNMHSRPDMNLSTSSFRGSLEGEVELSFCSIQACWIPNNPMTKKKTFARRKDEARHSKETQRSILNIYSNILDNFHQNYYFFYNKKYIYRLQNLHKCWTYLWTCVSDYS